MKVGRRLATKLLNVTKFVLGIVGKGEAPGVGAVTDPVDRAMLARLDATVTEATTAFEGFDYARALERTEAFFWWFCDDFVELVKGRAYGGRGADAAASAVAGLSIALAALQRLLAPMLPFATEEAWSWSHDTSVHVAAWPVVSGIDGDGGDLDVVSEVLATVRRAKTEAKQSQRASVARLTVTVPAAARPALDAARADLVDALTVVELDIVDGDELATTIELG